MIQRLYAVVFVALAASPFTAPFQACTPVPSPMLVDQNDPGSAVGPLATAAGRLTIVTGSIALASRFVVTPPGSIVTGSFTSAIVHGTHSVLPTILRV